MKSNKGIVAQIILIVLFIAFVIGGIKFFENPLENVEEPETNLTTIITEKEVESINVTPVDNVFEITGTYYEVGEDPETEKGTYFDVNVAAEGDDFDTVIDTALENDVDIITNQARTDNLFGLFIEFMFPLLILGVMFFLMFKMMTRNGMPNLTQNKAKLSIKSDYKFSDVVGYEEEKQELQEIVEFLKNPKDFVDIGANVPNGVLLEGPPGTGKTLIAKAVAGEVGVPFYYISGSDFIEVYVGVGPNRVKSLFKEAKKQEKAIIFIDEIDAIGSRENSNVGSRHNEKEQTINQLLVELDGFASEEGGIIVIGATNRADKLDPALLRSGRFDRKVVINLPELSDREGILKYHANKRKYSEDIDFLEIARMTTGMSGAQLEAVTNEAAILAVREDRSVFGKSDITEAIDRVLMGPAKVSNKYSDRDKKIVSYHESGHAISGLNVKGSNMVQKITIIPRRNAGGYVSYTPTEDNQKTITKTELEAQLITLLSGRAAEELFIGQISRGAHNDFERATEIARAMVTRLGMSDLGISQFESTDYLEGKTQKTFSDKLNTQIDEKVNEILTESYNKAKELLTTHSDDMHLLAEAIRKYESLDRTDIDYLLEHRELESRLG